MDKDRGKDGGKVLSEAEGSRTLRDRTLLRKEPSIYDDSVQHKRQVGEGLSSDDITLRFAETESDTSMVPASGPSPSFPPSPSVTPAAVGGSSGWGADQSRGGMVKGAGAGSRVRGAAAGLPPAGAAPAGNAGSSTSASEERDSQEDTNTSGSLHHMCPPPPSTPTGAGGRVGQGGDGGSGGMGEGTSDGSRVGDAAAVLPSAGAAPEGNAEKAGNDGASASKRQPPEEVLVTNTNGSIFLFQTNPCRLTTFISTLHTDACQWHEAYFE